MRMRQSPSTSTRTVLSGKLQHLEHARGAADLVHFLRASDFPLPACAASTDAEQAVAGDDVVDQLGALRRFDEQRRDHAGKDDDVRKAEDRAGPRGSEWAETRAGASGFPAAPRMLINSVSGEVIVASFCKLDAAAPEKIQRSELIPLGDWHLGAFRSAIAPAAHQCAESHSDRPPWPG